MRRSRLEGGAGQRVRAWRPGGRQDTGRPGPMIDSFQLKLPYAVTLMGKVKVLFRLRPEPDALWLLHVLVIPQRRQTHPPQGHAGGVDVLRAVCGGQLSCKRATGEPLRPAKGRQAGAHCRRAATRRLIRLRLRPAHPAPAPRHHPGAHAPAAGTLGGFSSGYSAASLTYCALGVRIVTSSSAAVGCKAIVESKSALVAFILTAMPSTCTISAAPSPTI